MAGCDRLVEYVGLGKRCSLGECPIARGRMFTPTDEARKLGITDCCMYCELDCKRRTEVCPKAKLENETQMWEILVGRR